VDLRGSRTVGEEGTQKTRKSFDRETEGGSRSRVG
jgi:hypothetical protein